MARKKQSIVAKALGVLGLGAAVSGARRLVGLDLGTHSVKAIELTRVGGDVAITGFAHAPVLPDGQPIEAIHPLLNERGLSRSPVATAVSGQSVIVRYILLPETSDDKLATAVRDEAPKYIPFDTAGVILDFKGLGSHRRDNDTTEVRVALVAAKKEFIYQHLAQVQDAGLQLQAIDVDCFAIANAFDFYRQRQPEPGEEQAGEQGAPTAALVEIGEGKTVINVVEKGELAFTREVYISGKDFTHEIVRRMEVDTETAERLKQDPGDLTDQVGECVSRVLDELGREVRLSFDYFEHQTDSSVQRVFLSGGGARLAGLREAFEEKVGRPAVRWDPIEGLPVDEENVDVEDLRACAPDLAVAVGLASRVL